MKRGKRPGAILMATLAVFMFAQTAIGASWLPVRRVGGHMAGTGAMAMAGSNTIGMAYTAIPWPEGRVYFSRSSDGGATWQPGVPMSPVDVDAHDAALAGLANHFDVVWRQQDANGDHRVRYRHSADRGATWGAPKWLSQTGVGAFPPRVARDGNGRVAVVWVGAELGAKLYVRVSVDGGVTWGPRRTLDESASWSSYPNVAIGKGKVHVAFNDAGQVVYRRSGDNGGTWSAPVALVSSIESHHTPAMAVTDHVLLVGYTRRNPSGRWVAFRPSRDNGRHWEPQVTLASQAARDTWGLVLSVRSGTWRALFARCDSDDPCSASAPQLVMRFSGKGADSWSGSRVISTGGYDAATPVGIRGADRAVVAWMREYGGAFNGVYARRQQ